VKRGEREKRDRIVTKKSEREKKRVREREKRESECVTANDMLSF
jgi:hypothetical protein